MVFKSSMLPLFMPSSLADKSCEKVTIKRAKLAALLTCIRPGSESKAPGGVIMRNCADGIERVFSHGGDALNDGFAHDAFDCYRLLECGSDYAKALNWNSEITKHNQRLYIHNTFAKNHAAFA